MSAPHTRASYQAARGAILDDAATVRRYDQKLAERKWLNTAFDEFNALRDLESEVVLLDISHLDDQLWAEANAPILREWVRQTMNARRSIRNVRLKYEVRLSGLLLAVDVILAGTPAGR